MEREPKLTEEEKRIILALRDPVKKKQLLELKKK